MPIQKQHARCQPTSASLKQQPVLAMVNQSPFAISADSYRLAFEAVPQPMWIYDPDTLRFLAVNDAAVFHYGYSREEFLSMTIADIRPEEDIEKLERVVQRNKHAQRVNSGLWTHRKKDGTQIIVEVRSSPMDLGHGRLGRAVMATDVTARLDAEKALEESERRFRELFEHATVGVFQTSVDGRYIRVNPALSRMYGYDSPQQLSDLISDISTSIYAEPERRDQFMHEMETKGIVHEFESEIFTATGDKIWISENARAVKDLTGKIIYYEGFVENVTERKAIEAERERLLADALERADSCPLTGLLNHRAFHKRLGEEADRAQRMNRSMAIAVLDLDNFKFFNDAYGHAAGDSVLLKVASNLRACCRTYDILARFGGDEFAVIMPDVTPDFADSFADRVQAVMDQCGFQPEGYDMTIPLGISVGLSLFPNESASRLEALELADARLRRIKSGAIDENLTDRLRSNYSHSITGFSVLDALVTAVDNKDRYTRRHSEDVVLYCLMIAKQLDLDESIQECLQIGALLHDVGKIGVPDHILRKPGSLTAAEHEAIRQHPTMGAMIVSAVPGFALTIDAIRHHHERWDGHGYPDGLAGEATPFTARIMAVADAYSAMTTSRPYRQGMKPEDALEILRAGAGTQWDPLCVDAFLAVWEPVRV